MIARWQEHLRRWPADEGNRQADRTPDEPGGWRGEDGRSLSPTDNRAADEALARIRGAEPSVTGALQEVAESVPGAQLVGLEHRVKEPDRFKEKIVAGLTFKRERSAAEIAEEIPDGLRYTLQIDADRYTSGYGAACRQLQRNGFDLTFSRNTWRSDQYVGVNTRWRGQDQQVFELQFHTAESLTAKELTHAAYERLRNTSTDPREMGELQKFQRDVMVEVSLPRHAVDVPDVKPPRQGE